IQVVVNSPGSGIAAALLDPDGAEVVDFIDNEPQQTTATELSLNTNTMPYQTSSNDAVIRDGRYTENIFFRPPGREFNGVVISKNDPDTERGRVLVNVVLVGSDAQRFQQEIKDAIDIWKTIYAAINVTVVIDTNNLPFVPSGTGILPNPGFGSV